MEPPLTALLTGGAFHFMLALCRCGAVFMLLPGFAEEETPMMLRAGFAGLFSLLILPLAAPHFPPMPADFVHLALLAAGEILAGFFLGWLTRLVCLSLAAAGQILSLSTGLSSVLQPDANFGAQASGPGVLLGRLAPVLLLATPLWTLPVAALAGSYDAWPPGSTPPVADVTQTILRATSAHVALAVRLAAPFLFIGFIWQMALGLMSRLVPQLQIYFAALPGQVLGGLLIMAALGGVMARVFLAHAGEALAALPGN